ncbi:hypothetical protein A2U01_0076802, partial [Trifolium medium]|nr:hypothetical protein [Trifolium medium]
FVSPRDLLGHFEAFVGLGMDKRARSILSLVWHAVVWSIWKFHNDVIFSERPFSVDDPVDSANRSPWICFSWIRASLSGSALVGSFSYSSC